MTVVLFVDDEPEVTEGLRLALRHYPFEVLTADSAASALDILARSDVNIVVSDERMAGVPGSAFLTQVRRDFPGVERMLLTGQASVEATITAINDAQVFRVLTKPCPTDTIVASINDALDAQRARSAAGASVLDRERSQHVLTTAIETIDVVYQPIFDGHLRVVACEALMRPRSPVLPTPDVLIEEASRLSAQFEVDRHIRALVGAELASAPHAPDIFVNVLPESLADSVLTSSYDPLAPHAPGIVIEVTERANLSVVDELQDQIERLRARGFRLALDDLGAGYAGLASFAQLQPDIVKFDLSLVRDIDTAPTKAKLVQSMVKLCIDMGITTVAECIENEAELSTLQGLGCDLFQGYLLGRPVPGIPVAGTPAPI